MSDKPLENGDPVIPEKKERSKPREREESEEFCYDPMGYPSFNKKS